MIIYREALSLFHRETSQILSSFTCPPDIPCPTAVFVATLDKNGKTQLRSLAMSKWPNSREAIVALGSAARPLYSVGRGEAAP